MKTSSAWFAGSLAAGLLACEAAPKSPVVAMVPATTDGGKPAPASTSPPTEEATAEQLEALLDELIAVVEAAIPRCAATTDSQVIAHLRQGEAVLFADRDELAIRRRRNHWEGRDLATWTHERKKQGDTLRELAARCTRDHP